MHAADDQQHTILLIPSAIDIIEGCGNSANRKFYAAGGMPPDNPQARGFGRIPLRTPATISSLEIISKLTNRAIFRTDAPARSAANLLKFDC